MSKQRSNQGLQTTIALLVWIIVTITICVYGQVTGWSRSVTGAYAEGAQSWIDGVNVYALSTSGMHGFLYPPQFAIAWTPFVILPDDLGNILWRIFTITLFACGCWKIYRVSERLCNDTLILLMTILTIPAALSAMRNGQSTLPMTGAMLLGTACLMEKHWWRGTIWLLVAVLFKPPAIALLLVAWVAFPPLWWRVPLSFAVFLLLPFLAQRPSFVLEFYEGFLEKASNKMQPSLADEVHVFKGADVISLARTAGLELSAGFALLIRMLAGIATLLLSLFALVRFKRHAGILLLASCGMTYVALFNPAAENNSYAVIAPIMAVFALMSLSSKQAWPGFFLLALPIFLAINYETTKHLTPGHTEWLCPLSTLLFAIYLCTVILGIGALPWRPRSSQTA